MSAHSPVLPPTASTTRGSKNLLVGEALTSAEAWPLDITDVVSNPTSSQHPEHLEVTKPTGADLTSDVGDYTFTYA